MLTLVYPAHALALVLSCCCNGSLCLINLKSVIMAMHQLFHPEGKLADVQTLQATRKRSETRLFALLFAITIGITPLMTLVGVQIGFLLLASLGVVILCLLFILRWPSIGLFLAVGCVVLIEQNARPIPIGTDRLYLFYWPPQLEGLVERPIGFFFLFTLLILVGHRLSKRQRPLLGGPLFWPYCCFLLCVAWGVLHGLTSGGSLKSTVLEVRPLWYLFLSYMLAYNLLERKEQVQVFFWLVILGATFKGWQGVYIFIVQYGGQMHGHNEIMSHEESFFFVALLLLVMLFCLHHRRRGQFLVALLALPPVIFSTIANDRRADYVALLAGMGVAWCLIFVLKKRLRPLLIALMLFCALLGGAYTLAFSHASGLAGAPARAVLSVFNAQPTIDKDEYSSNIYRDIENFDLKYTAKQNPLLGYGFGKEFLQPVPLPDISEQDPYYTLVPHNTIYWIWMRLGPAGYLALWYLFGALIVRGCIIARTLRDPYLQLVAIYVVAVAVMEIIVAYADYQLFFYRNVIYLGLLAGILFKLPTLDAAQQGGERNETTRHIPLSAVAHVGR